MELRIRLHGGQDDLPPHSPDEEAERGHDDGGQKQERVPPTHLEDDLAEVLATQDVPEGRDGDPQSQQSLAKVLPHREAMQEKIGEALGLAPERIGIKATTNELLGAIGRQEGIAAMAVALIKEA